MWVAAELLFRRLDSLQSFAQGRAKWLEEAAVVLSNLRRRSEDLCCQA